MGGKGCTIKPPKWSRDIFYGEDGTLYTSSLCHKISQELLICLGITLCDVITSISGLLTFYFSGLNTEITISTLLMIEISMLEL